MNTISHTAAGLQLGVLSNADGNLRALIQFLAIDPLYSQVPISNLKAMLSWLEKGHIVGASVAGSLIGAAAWTLISDERARQCIRDERLPLASERLYAGEAVLLTMIAGSQQGTVTRLIRHLIGLHSGRIMLYARHRTGNAANSRFGWIDRKGRNYGDALN